MEIILCGRQVCRPQPHNVGRRFSESMPFGGISHGSKENEMGSPELPNLVRKISSLSIIYPSNHHVKVIICTYRYRPGLEL